jgi:hypothetical protein
MENPSIVKFAKQIPGDRRAFKETLPVETPECRATSLPDAAKIDIS